MYTFKLTHLVLNDDTLIQPGNLVIIVGPNNAGKSRTLKEIAEKTTTSRAGSSILVKEVKWTMPQDIQELRDAYKVERSQNDQGRWVFRTLAPELCQEHQIDSYSWPDGYEHMFQSEESYWMPNFAEQFGNAMVAFLTTEHRLQLVKGSSHPYAGQPASLLQTLYFAGRQTEETIRALVKHAFGQEIALDFTVPQRLLLRVGEDFSSIPPDPRDALIIMDKYEKLDEQGDGIRSFVGVVLAMLVSKRGLFLIDEPEAFLHPPQAFRIGEFLAERANNAHQLIVATHSADVLRGILSKTQDVTILRIDRTGNTNYFRQLNPNRLKELVHDPLLSSARVLDGLFYSGAIVVEADSDARFYHIVSNKRRNDIDLHFVNADNKQTVPRITKMYRDMGVRCAGIVDFDVLNNRVEFAKQLEALAFSKDELDKVLTIQGAIAQSAKEIPPNERLEDTKTQLNELLDSVNALQSRKFVTEAEATLAKEKLLRQLESRFREVADYTKGWRQFKQQGRAALLPNIQSQFDALWEICAEHALFINPCGELESMLTEYGILHTTDKRGWIIQALQLLPYIESEDEKYPWKFIKSIYERLFN